MSTLTTTNVEIGQSLNEADNFILYQPVVPDGTIRIKNAQSNVDVVSFSVAGSILIANTTLFSADFQGPVKSKVESVVNLNIDCLTGNYFTKTVAGNSTFTFSNPPSVGVFGFTLKIIHISGIVTWPSSVRWPGDTAPTLNTGKTHLITFISDDGGTIWLGSPQSNYQV